MPMRDRLAYLCPGCGEELHRGQICPHCKLKSKLFDLGGEERDLDHYYDSLQERDYRRRYDT